MLAVVVVASGVVTSLEAATRGYDLSGDLTRWSDSVASDFEFADLMMLPFTDGLVFGGFVAGALFYRRRPAVHNG